MSKGKGRNRPEDKPWQPLHRSTISLAEKAHVRALYAAAGEGEPRDEDEVWVNDEYQVFVTFIPREDGPGSKDGMVHLSIKRNDKRPVQDWREKQAIKNEVVGPEREAIELYPAESRLVDEADQAHLWVFPVGDPLPIGFQQRRVQTDEERRAELAKVSTRAATKGSQRAWRPGLPTGPGGQ